MKLYTSIGPNPRVVSMFAARKGLTLPSVVVDVIAGENRREAYLAINPAGQTPALELDNGTVLAESIAICEYLEELHPEPALMGSTPEARALTRMWIRRIDQGIVQPLTAGFRGAEGLALFKDRVRCLPQAADDLKLSGREGLAWLDKQMEGRDFIAGDAMTVADLLLYSFLEFGAMVGQGLDRDNRNLAAWQDRMAKQPGVAATA